MKRSGVLLLCLCLLGAAGCSDDGPTNPSNLPIVMTASLSPSNEVPAIASPENTGFGNVQITFNVTRDSTGAITAGTADFLFQLTGFPSSTTIIAAHIHPGAAGVNGGVIVSGSALTGPVQLFSGVGSLAPPTGAGAPPAETFSACGSAKPPLTRCPGALALGSCTVSVASAAVEVTVAGSVAV